MISVFPMWSLIPRHPYSRYGLYFSYILIPDAVCNSQSNPNPYVVFNSHDIPISLVILKTGFIFHDVSFVIRQLFKVQWTCPIFQKGNRQRSKKCLATRWVILSMSMFFFLSYLYIINIFTKRYCLPLNRFRICHCPMQKDDYDAVNNIYLNHCVQCTSLTIYCKGVDNRI